MKLSNVRGVMLSLLAIAIVVAAFQTTGEQARFWPAFIPLACAITLGLLELGSRWPSSTTTRWNQFCLVGLMPAMLIVLWTKWPLWATTAAPVPFNILIIPGAVGAVLGLMFIGSRLKA